MYSAPKRSSSSRVRWSIAFDSVADSAQVSFRSTKPASARRLGSNHERATCPTRTFARPAEGAGRPRRSARTPPVLRPSPRSRAGRAARRVHERRRLARRAPWRAPRSSQARRGGADRGSGSVRRRRARGGPRAPRRGGAARDASAVRRTSSQSSASDGVAPGRARLEPLERALEHAEQRNALPHLVGVPADHRRAGVRGRRRAPADLGKGQAEPPERDDRVETLGVLRPVQAVARLATLDRLEQPDGLVVAKRSRR